MANHPLVILGSARRHSDTEKCVELLFKHQPHKVIQLLDFKIEPYRYSPDYSLEDNFLTTIDLVLLHEVILFATPVYWYAMSGLLKTFFDRFTDLVTIRKDLGRKLKGKKVFLLAVGTDDEIPSGFTIPFKLTAEYFDMHFVGYLYVPAKQMDTYFSNTPAPKAFLQNISIQVGKVYLPAFFLF